MDDLSNHIDNCINSIDSIDRSIKLNTFTSEGMKRIALARRNRIVKSLTGLSSELTTRFTIVKNR